MSSQWLVGRWYSSQPPPALLRPLAWLYTRIADARRAKLQMQAPALNLPVIVVGNISVGGTGKTPFVIWLVRQLQAWGFRPGVVSRGYGGRAPRYPHLVSPQTEATASGDEPLLIARATSVPVMIDPDRVRAVRGLIEQTEVDIIVSDDGLQHYRLSRDLEICVVDGTRGFGNGACLPAGPLREPVSRLQEIPLVVINGGGMTLDHGGKVDMHLAPGSARRLGSAETLPLAHWRGQRMHAVAGIGNPQRFFNMLRELGLEPIEHPYPDHHAFSAQDLNFSDALPILMTEKDAVKCEPLGLADAFAVPVEAVLSEADTRLVQQFCESLRV